MVWACGKIGRVPYGQKGANGESKRRYTSLRRMGSGRVAFGNRGMTVKAARQFAKDRKEWRALMHM